MSINETSREKKYIVRGYHKCPKCLSGVNVTFIDDKKVSFLCKNENCEYEFSKER